MFGKSINDLGWCEFAKQLSCKSEWSGSFLYKVDRYFPSSKLCSSCGIKNITLKLSDTSWTCGSCNTLHDNRYVHLLKNILMVYAIIDSYLDKNVSYSLAWILN
ncbi:zinc ribbon domain-containing protein (plasmid) [Borreliella tanukii]|uniref:zinc ribbon domain-containing protein n=1 Tax=Borreliella tanukii TaxID=56146 RepID=UPI003AF0C3C4